MKISLVFMCVLGFYFSNSTLIQYKSGTIIKQEKVINAGSNTMNLIIHIPQLKNQTDYFYFRPCKYMNYIQEDLFNAGIASNVSTIRTQFTKVCKVFTKLKNINNKFKRSYEEQIDKSLEAISLLTHASRDKRSIFSALRHTFNIGSYNKQKQLESVVRNLESDQISTEGDIIKMKFIITHQEDRIEQLKKSAAQITNLLQDMNVYSNELVDMLNAERVVNHYRDKLFFDLMTAGILANELLQEYTNVMKERVEAFAVLQRHYLPHNLVSPIDLKTILNKLVTQLSGQHQFLKLHHENIYTYYSIRNVNFYLQEDQYFIQIPVLLKMYGQEFRLYSLQPVHLPLPNQENQWMIAIHKPYIAVNSDSGTYMTLNENWYDTLECQGRNNVYCKAIITEHFIENHHTCEYSIVQNKTNDIKEHCEFAIMGKEQLSPRLHNIGDSRVILENPKEERVYRKCKDDIQGKFLTQEKLVEVMVPCFCSLYSEAFTTTMITSDNCITTIEVKLYNPIDNIIFLRLLLNNLTVESNIATNLIPKLHLPNLIQNFMVKDESNLLNLKDVLKAHKSQYYHTARNTLTRHETLTKAFSIFKISAMITPIFGIMIISVIICLCCRTKKIGNLFHYCL